MNVQDHGSLTSDSSSLSPLLIFVAREALDIARPSPMTDAAKTLMGNYPDAKYMLAWFEDEHDSGFQVCADNDKSAADMVATVITSKMSGRDDGVDVMVLASPRWNETVNAIVANTLGEPEEHVTVH